MLKAFVLLSALAVAGPASAQVFKCTGKDGRVTYSQTKPTGGDCQENAVTPPPLNGGNVDNLKQFSKEIDKERRQDSAAQEKAEDRAARKAARCASARRSLALLQQTGAVFTMDDKGERHYESDAQRQQRIDAAQAGVASECN